MFYLVLASNYFKRENLRYTFSCIVTVGYNLELILYLYILVLVNLSRGLLSILEYIIMIYYIFHSRSNCT